MAFSIAKPIIILTIYKMDLNFATVVPMTTISCCLIENYWILQILPSSIKGLAKFPRLALNK